MDAPTVMGNAPTPPQHHRTLTPRHHRRLAAAARHLSRQPSAPAALRPCSAETAGDDEGAAIVPFSDAAFGATVTGLQVTHARAPAIG